MGDKMTPQKAIQAFCLSCSGDSRAEVKRCSSLDCPLYPYRTGHVSNGRKLTEEQRQRAVEQLRKARESSGKDQRED